MPSFDVVSTVELHEVRNAVEQVQREVGTRYDFRGSKSEIDLDDSTIVLTADDEMKLTALQQILRERLAKRSISLKSVTFGDPEKIGGDLLRQRVQVRQGLTVDEVRELHKHVRSLKLKVTAQQQGDQLRVTGKKRDDLQKVIQFLQEQMTDIDLQFINFRD